MPYQPTHPHPYLETIDATNEVGHIFSVVINPKDVIAKYSFSIFSTENSSSLYNTGLITLTNPLYGTEDGAVLSVGISTDIDTGMVNGANYQWQIVLYDIAGNSISSPLYYFSTKKAPVITFDVPSTINTCEYTFNATFEQEQNEDYMYYQYSLYRDNVLIDETSEKMDSLLSYKYSGLISDSEYKIILTIVTSDRSTYKIPRIFNVNYDIQPFPLVSNVSQVSDKNCVAVDYSQNLFIKGNASDEITYSQYGDSTSIATIPEGSSIYYNKINEGKPISLGEYFTIYYSVHFSELFVGDIISLEDEVSGDKYIVKYDGRKFYYKIGYSSWVAIDPYIDANNIHKETSVVVPNGTTLEDINTDALYMLYADDVVNDDDSIIYNDITANFWWTFVLLPDKVLAYRGQKYIESVVS